MSKIIIKKEGWKCDRKICGHIWISQSEKKPICCPRCKSPFWDKTSRRKEKK